MQSWDSENAQRNLEIAQILRLRGTYMWQSHVEIEGYSVAYFDRIVAFEAPYR